MAIAAPQPHEWPQKLEAGRQRESLAMAPLAE
jgi:hypothetical protein